MLLSGVDKLRTARGERGFEGREKRFSSGVRSPSQAGAQGGEVSALLVLLVSGTHFLMYSSIAFI